MEIPLRRILIPIGGYTDPTPLLQLPDIIKDVSSVELILFGVVTVPFTTSLEQKDIVETEPYIRIKNKLEEVRGLLSNIGLSATVKLVISRNIPESIIEESISGEYDLIVLIKRMKPSRIIRRSVSQSILSRIPRPLLILTMD